MKIRDKVAEFIRSQTNLRHNKGVLVGLSGGPDSQVLLHILTSLNYSRIIAAHINYHQRGENSNLDEKCAKIWASKFSIEFRKKDVYPDKDIGNFQNEARKIRYDYFEKIKNEEKLDYILTAHHKNDQIETIAMRFFSGTRGLGLMGIPVDSNQRVRPLLCLTKKEILNYAKQHSIPYRLDTSNTETSYLRNFFRLEVLPTIQRKIPNLFSRLETTQENLKKEQKLLSHFTIQLITDYGHWKGPFLILPLNRFADIDILISFLMYLFKINENQSRQLTDSSSSGTLDCNPYRLCIFDGHLWITKMQKEESKAPLVLNKALPFSIKLNCGKLAAEKVKEFKKTNNPNVEYLPAKFISADLQMKKWSAGDRIEYQKGRHKKVSDLLNENQLSPFEKEAVYCLWHENELIWVVGIRLSVKGYIKSKSEHYLRLEYIPEKSTTPTKEDIVSIMAATIT